MTEKSATNGAYLLERLQALNSPFIRDIRGAGLLVGVDIDPAKATAREICERLQDVGILCKETHETVIRFAPPLTITREELDYAVDKFRAVLSDLAAKRPA